MRLRNSFLTLLLLAPCFAQSCFAQSYRTSLGAANVQGATGNVKAAPYYASGSSFATTSTAAASASATTIALTSVGDFTVNEGMLIGVSGATPGTTTAVVTITGISGLTVTFTPALVSGSSYASGTNVQHDDSAAFQSTSTAMGVSGGGVFSVPTGYYRLNNCNATNSSVVSLPAIAQTGYQALPLITIGWTGTYQQGIMTGTTQLAPVIQTDCASGNLFIAPTVTGGSDTGFTAITPYFNNLIIRSYNNPGVALLNMLWAASLSIPSLVVDSGSIPTSTPTHSNGIGIITPGPENTARVELGDVSVLGQYEGIRAGAHAELGHVFLWFDLYALTINTASSGGWDHAVHGNFVDIEACKYLLSPSGSYQQVVYIDHLQTEEDTGFWFSPATTINDASNNLWGSVSIETTINTPTITGGLNLAVNIFGNPTGAPVHNAAQTALVGNYQGSIYYSVQNNNTQGYAYYFANDSSGNIIAKFGYNDSSASSHPSTVGMGTQTSVPFNFLCANAVCGTMTGAGVFEWGTAQQLQVGTNGVLTVPYILPQTIYSAAGTALPTCNSGIKGAKAEVSDATSPTFLGTYTSGGAVQSPVMCNGTNWVAY